MGKVFLIQFDQTPENRFYLCRTCQAHIVLSQDLNFGFIDQELSGTVFENVVNVYTRSPEQDRTVGNRVVSDVYCNQCNNLMGIKFIEVPNDEPMVREGYFLLKTAKLSRWNGQDTVDVEL